MRQIKKVPAPTKAQGLKNKQKIFICLNCITKEKKWRKLIIHKGGRK